MPEVQTRTVEDLAEVLRNTGSGCSLLIGAGCSKSAGIPLAGEFVETIKKDYPRAFERAAAPKEYPQCMAQLDHGLRRDLINGYVNAAKLNWAHIGMACLFQADYVQRILTVNFDPLVVRSCGLLGEFPAVYDLAVSENFRVADIPDKAVLYLHGQHTGFVLLNTEEETRRHAARLTPIFDDSMRRRVWIVVGYSGVSDPIVEDLLSKVSRFDYGLYWVTYRDSMPPATVQEKLLSDPEKNAYLIKGEDADSFFIKLNQELRTFPPAIIAHPFMHLAEQVKLLPPYPISDESGQDVTSIQLQRIEKAIEQYEREAVPEAIGAQSGPLPQEMLDSITVAAQKLLISGDYEGVIKLRWAWEQSRDGKLANLLVGAFISQGQGLVNEARGMEPSQALNLYAQAGSLYKSALEIDRENADALHAWGNLLGEQADRAAGPQAKNLYEQSAAKFEAAVAHRPDKYNAWNNWGRALYQLTKFSSGDEAVQLAAASVEKFEKATSGDPTNYVWLHNLGTGLMELAQEKDDPEAEQLLTRAIQQLRASIAAKPDNMHATISLGLALAKWGTRHATADDAPGTLADAKRLLLTAKEKNPEYASYRLACLYAMLSDPEGCKKALEHTLELKTLPARQRLLTDPDLASVRHLDWFRKIVEQATDG